MNTQEEKMETVEISAAQKSARKKRNIAIGLCLFAWVAIFYVATITKFGPRVADRPIISIESD